MKNTEQGKLLVVCRIRHDAFVDLVRTTTRSVQEWVPKRLLREQGKLRVFRNKRQRAAYFTNSDYHCALARTAAISSYSWNSSKVTQLEKNINVAMFHPLLFILSSIFRDDTLRPCRCYWFTKNENTTFLSNGISSVCPGKIEIVTDNRNMFRKKKCSHARACIFGLLNLLDDIKELPTSMTEWLRRDLHGIEGL
ncbi:hypothetical protein V1477_004743 [Vespula maculifrons]|uniref:Uncharacterized protein n=1 Tax=Vespula maculifrons TaxID=7453 RepID=A0ABD2CQF1_VESMC